MTCTCPNCGNDNAYLELIDENGAHYIVGMNGMTPQL